MKMYMAIDQYGHTYHGLKHPRKDLCERLCCSHVEKMYQDKKDGTTVFCGYIIGGLWLQLFEVQPVERRCNMVLVALLLFPVLVVYDCMRKNK